MVTKKSQVKWSFSYYERLSIVYIIHVEIMVKFYKDQETEAI